MPNMPPVHELEFLRQSNNHLELDRKLALLGMANPVLQDYAQFVCRAWFGLGLAHLSEANALLVANCSRATYSRAYYAAYNASKAVRYIANGFVSLKGDDHGKASADLPGDFPDLNKWASDITNLYAHRLRADYDNWSDTNQLFTLLPPAAVQLASDFLSVSKTYIHGKTGMLL